MNNTNTSFIFREHSELSSSHPERPEHNQTEVAGHNKIEEKLEKLAKIIISKSSLPKSHKEKPSEKSENQTPCCQLDRNSINDRSTEQESYQTKPHEKLAVAEKEEIIKKPEVEPQLERPETELGDLDHTLQNEQPPSSSHVSTSKKSCRSCAERNTVCLGECPTLKKTGDDKT